MLIWPNAKFDRIGSMHRVSPSAAVASRLARSTFMRCSATFSTHQTSTIRPSVHRNCMVVLLTTVSAENRNAATGG